MMICRNCGKIMPDGVRFCANCGTPFHVSYPPPQYPDPQMQPYYGQDVYRQYGCSRVQKLPPSAKDIASLLLGSLSVLIAMNVMITLFTALNLTSAEVMLCSMPIGFIMGIVGVILGASGKKKDMRHRKRSSIAMIGWILSVIGMSVELIAILLVTLCFLFLAGFVVLLASPYLAFCI